MAGLISWLKLIMMNTRMNLGRVLSNFAVIRKFSNGWSNRILDNEDILYQNLYIYIFKSIKREETIGNNGNSYNLFNIEKKNCSLI